MMVIVVFMLGRIGGRRCRMVTVIHVERVNAMNARDIDLMVSMRDQLEQVHPWQDQEQDGPDASCPLDVGHLHVGEPSGNMEDCQSDSLSRQYR